MISNFIPTLWAGMLLRQLEKALVFGQPGVINRNYEGEIKEKGDSVKITSIGPVTISTYTRNTALGTPQVLQDAGQMLQITEAKSFNFLVDDLDKAQAAGSIMEQAMQEAAYGLRNTADRFLAALYSSVASANFYGTDASPKTISAATDAYNYLVALKTILDENNVPDEGRWAILPPFLEGEMLKDDRFVKSGTPVGDQTLRNGVVAQAAGFDVMLSNNVSHNGSGDIPVANDECRAMAGHPLAWTYAEQIVEMEALRSQDYFGDLVRGLHVYGAKVTRPSALAVLTITRP